MVDPDSFLTLLSTNVPHNDVNIGKIPWGWVIGGCIGIAGIITLIIIRRKKRFSKKITKN